MKVLLQDVAYGFRQFRKTPGFTVTVLLTLGLGIGDGMAGLDHQCAGDFIHRIHGKEVFGRIGIDAVSVKSFWRNADNGGRLGIDVKRASHNVRIARVVLLPCVIAHHGGNWRALPIIGIRKEPARRRQVMEQDGIDQSEDGRVGPSTRYGPCALSELRLNSNLWQITPCGFDSGGRPQPPR